MNGFNLRSALRKLGWSVVRDGHLVSWELEVPGGEGIIEAVVSDPDRDRLAAHPDDVVDVNLLDGHRWPLPDLSPLAVVQFSELPGKTPGLLTAAATALESGKSTT